jgi:hypothetical protein
MRRKIARDIIDSPDFDETDCRKYILREHSPLIEFRSRWINDNVRANAKQLEGWSGLKLADARYQRVKDAAIAMIPHLLNDYGMEPGEAQMYQRALCPPTTVPNLLRAQA